MLPATQKTEELVGGVHPSGTVEPLRAASGEGPKDAQMEGNAQLSCSVKEEPDGYVQETGEVRVYEGWGPLRVQRGESRRGCAETGGSWSGSGVPSWEAGPTRTGSPGGWALTPFRVGDPTRTHGRGADMTHLTAESLLNILRRGLAKTVSPFPYLL